MILIGSDSQEVETNRAQIHRPDCELALVTLIPNSSSPLPGWAYPGSSFRNSEIGPNAAFWGILLYRRTTGSISVQNIYPLRLGNMEQGLPP